MKQNLKKVVSFAMCIAMLSGLLPAEALAAGDGTTEISSQTAADTVSEETYASVGQISTNTVTEETHASEEQTSTDVRPEETKVIPDDILERAENLLVSGGDRSRGGWHYVVLKEENWAVVTGYDGEIQDGLLEVPDILGGADTVGISADALCSLEGLKSIQIPINIFTIGNHAFPKGTIVKANSGVYAQKWARVNGYTFESMSEYDFVSGVIDLTGIRAENYHRVSAEEIWFRALEASQLPVGSSFFLLDPDNLYQISYYEVIKRSEAPDGFISLECVTPDVNEILNYYEAKNEKLVIDPATVRTTGYAEVAENVSDKYKGSVEGTDGLNLNINVPPFQIGDAKLKFSGGLYSTLSADYEIGLFTTNKVTIKQEDKLELKASIEGKKSYWDDGDFLDKAKEYTLKEFVKSSGTFLADSHNTSIPLGSVAVFSVGGILNGVITVKAVFELKGKLSVSYSSTTTTTYTYVEGKDPKVETRAGEKSINGSASGTVKVGIEAAFELYITAVKVFTAELFLGLEGEAKMDFTQLFNLLGNTALLPVSGDTMVFKDEYNFNMLDCVQVEIKYLVEVSLSVGIGELTTQLGKWKLEEEPLLDLHIHFFDFILDQSFDQANGNYTYTVSDKLKNKVHTADHCPYKVFTVRFLLPDGQSDRVLARYPNLAYGTNVDQPDIDLKKTDGLKLISWHSDASLDKKSKIKSWPQEITGLTDYYAKTSPYHNVWLMNADGTTMNIEVTVRDRNTKGSWTDHDIKKQIAENESLVLPKKNEKNEDILAWVQVASRDQLLPVGDELNTGTSFDVKEGLEKDIYLLGLTGKDITARFYYGFGDDFAVSYCRRDGNITVPVCEITAPARVFAGWEDEEGNLYQPGESIRTDAATPSILVYSASWEYSGDQITAENLPDLTIGQAPGRLPGSPVSDEELFTWDEEEGNAVITGFSYTYHENPYMNIAVPASIDGKTVVRVSDNAFGGTEALRVITFPSTLQSIGAGALRDCENLMMIDLYATQITMVPDYLAYGDSALACVLVPDSGVDTIGMYAFWNCGTLTAVQVDSVIGENAFEGCYKLSSVTLGRKVTEIGAGAFSGCTSLKELSLPDSVISIGSGVINGDTALQSLKIKGGIEAIDTEMFRIGEGSQLQNLEIGYGVREIGYAAFANGDDGFGLLTSVTLPASLKVIGSYAFNGAGIQTLTVAFSTNSSISDAFRGCSSLTIVNVVSGSISGGAFCELPGLTTVNLGSGVTRIGDYAFADCPMLETVNMESGLLRIGSGAFANCPSLTNLTIPDTVYEIGSSFISGDTVLTSLSVGKTLNQLSDSPDSFAIGENSSLSVLIIREGAERIPDYMFANGDYGFGNLKTITLPESMRSIGYGAFRKAGVQKLILNGAMDLSSGAFEACTSLEEIIIQGGEIGDGAFQANTMLKKVTVYAGSIGNEAFQNCTSLTTLKLGDGVKAVGNRAFYNCTALNSADLGNGVRSIGEGAFENCSALKTLVFPDSVTSYGAHMIFGCSALTDLTIGGGQPMLTNSDIWKYYYYYNNDYYPYYFYNYAPFVIGAHSSLTTLTIREGVREISNDVFNNYNYWMEDGNVERGYKNLTTVNLPSTLQYIDTEFVESAVSSLIFKSSVEILEGAFQNLQNLRTVSLPGGSVGGAAFANCPSLTNINLGNGVYEIGAEAFKGCVNLSSLTLPDSVSVLGPGVLDGCTGLEYLSVGAEIDDMSAAIELGENAKLRMLVIRDGATTLQSGLFQNGEYHLKNLETVSLPATLQYIGDFAFQGAAVQRIRLTGETYIGSGAFEDCSRLTEVELFSSEIARHAFHNAVSLKKVTLLSGMIGSGAFENCVSMQEIHLGNGVTGIFEEAFRNCRSLKDLTIPDSVTGYGYDIIYGCTGLENLSIGSGVEDIEPVYYYWRDKNCFRIGPGAHLKSLSIAEGVKTLGDGAFANPVSNDSLDACYGYPMLTEVSLPGTLESIGSQVFQGSALRKLTVKGTPSIANYAFKGLTALKSVKIHGGTIGDDAFENCTGLQTVVLGNQVTEIGFGAFEGCKALTSLSIPESVKSYGDRLIYGCESLEALTLGGGVTEIREGVFDIGSKNTLRTLVMNGNVTRIDAYAFANLQRGEPCGFQDLDMVILSEHVASLTEGNLMYWPKLRHLYSMWGAILRDDTVSSELTLYTDYYNRTVDSFANAHNLTYIVREQASFPDFTLTLAVSDGSAEISSSGEAAELPDGFSILSQSQVAYTETLDLETPVVVNGYGFYGWYTDPEFGTPWTGDVMPAKDLTLYAKIRPLVHIRYAVNAAGAGRKEAALPNGFWLYQEYTAAEGDLFPVPEDPAPSGYTFIGWYTDSDFRIGGRLKEVPEEDVTIFGRLDRLSIGGEYTAVSGGVRLTRYTLEQNESPVVILPAKVGGAPLVSIAAGAFDGSGVQSVTIPSGVTDIAEGAFSGSTLLSVNVSEGNQVYSSEGGVLYNKDMTELLCYPSGRIGTEYSIPGTVVRIGDSAFANNVNIQEVSFNDGLTEIGASAFTGCRELQHITLPDSVTTLRKRAFEGCYALKRFEAYGLTTLETADVVNGRTVNVDTLPMGTGMSVYGPIGSGVLREYFTITDSNGKSYTRQYNRYKIGLSVDGKYDSTTCEAGELLPDILRNVKLSDGTEVKYWYRNDVEDPWDLDKDVMPAEDIMLYASARALFEYECGWWESADGNTSAYGLKLLAWHGTGGHLELPVINGDSVVTLGEGFLKNSEHINELIVGPELTIIEDGALDGFTGTIVTDRGTYAETWALAHNVSIDYKTFTLSYVTGGVPIRSMQAASGTAVSLPTPIRAGFNFTEWYYDAGFNTCVALDDDGYFEMPASDTALYAGWEGVNEDDVPYEWIEKDGQITITAYNGEETAIVIPDTIKGWPVTAISDEAFAEKGLTSLNTGENVTEIGDGAFRNCTSLRTVNLPAVERIGNGTFLGCSSLRSVTFSETLTELGSKVFEDCTALGEITIPDGVTTISGGTFYGCGSLKTIMIGSGVTELNVATFNGCTRLQEIVIDEANKNFSDVDGILFDVNRETLIYWPPCCEKTTYEVPSGVRMIGDSAFANAAFLTQVTMPDTVEVIGNSAFIGTRLTQLITEGVQQVGESAFFDCNELTEVDFGGSLQSIGSFAFVECDVLREVNIPQSAILHEDDVLFDANSGLVIVGKTGSSAHDYAIANGISFRDPDAVTVTGITLSQTELSMKQGEAYELNAVCTPEGTDAGITWYSNRQDVVLAGEDGWIRAIGGGTADIIARTDNGLTASCKVTVDVDVTELIPDVEALMTVGEERSISVTVVPENVTDASLTWAVADADIATVDENGVIKAVSAGETTVTVTSANGISAQIPVVVYTPVSSLAIVQTTDTMYAIEGMNTLQLETNVMPAGATFEDCLWISSDSSIARVDENGLVTAYSLGDVTITAISRDPSRMSAEIKLKVEAVDIAEVAEVEITEAHLDPYGGYTLEYKVSANGKELREDRDYSTYCDATDVAGNYKLTVNGDDRLTGTLTVPFEMKLMIPEITFTEEECIWASELVNMDNPVYKVVPEVSHSVEYVWIGENGKRVCKGSSPDSSGNYEMIVTTEETNRFAAVQASTTVRILVDVEIETYDTIELVPGQYGRIPIHVDESIPFDHPNFVYESSDEGVFTVDYYAGNIYATGIGKATLTIRGENDNRWTGHCEITVSDLDKITLPAALTTVEEEAFAGNNAMKRVVLVERVSNISDRAFANMENLKQVEIAGTKVSIADKAFYGSDPLIICEEGSTAETYAHSHGLKCIVH